MRCLALLALAAVTLGTAHAQQAAPPPDTLVAADYDAFTFVSPRALSAEQRGAATATFEFDLTGFPPEAEEALRFAASIWATHLESNVPIRVRAAFSELDAQTLGAAGPSCVESRPELPVPDTWYPIALAESFLGFDLNPPDASVCPGVDINATFNSALDVNSDGAIDWYYGTDGATPAGQYDLATVVLHELGHGLGFVGSFDVETGDGENGCPETLGDIPTDFGCWGIGSNPVLPLIFDRFAEDGQGVPLLDEGVYPNPSLALGLTLQSDAVRFDGPTALTANGTLPIDLYAPSNFEPGSSFSHLDEEVSPAGDPNSLMTPQLARAEAIFSPGPFTCAVMEDIGWRLGADCEALLEGGLASFIVRATEEDVVLVFRLGIGSGFTEAVLEGRDGDGVNFEPVAGAVPTDPNNADVYEIRLGRLVPGRYVFRLLLRRDDGSTFVSRELEVAVPPDRRLAVFPNPFTDAARVVLDLADAAEGEAVQVTVYDVLGRRVAELTEGPRGTSGVLERTLDGRRLAAGVYFVRAVGESFEVTQTVTRVR